MFLNPLTDFHVSPYRFFLAVALIALLSACGGDDSQNVADPGARTVPQSVTVATGTRMNALSWRGVSGARGYTVYWATESGVDPANGTAIQTRQPYFEHRGLANDTTYFYVVTSDTAFGQSASSAVVEGTPRAAPPARPGDLALQAGNGRITLRWEAVPGATHYTLYWQDHAGVETGENAGEGRGSTRIAQVVSPFVHPGLENGRDYFYRLVAENAHGAGEASAEHSAMPLAPPPSAPLITRAEVTSDQVTLHWQHSGEASHYTLLWGDTDPLESGGDMASLTQVTSPYTHAPLQEGQTYFYRVRTHNGERVSALSNLVQVTPPGEASVAEPGAVPAVPTGLTVNLENGQLSLDWPPVEGALGYNLYWLSGATGEVSTENTRITQIQPPYTHIQLNNGTLYRYRLSAFNDHGESALSTEVNGIPQVVLPGVPAGVQALAGDTSILLRWDPVQGATGYTLTVKDGDTSDTLTDVRSPYRITGLRNATPYQIQLQAQNTQGLGAPSAPVSATPQEPAPNTPGDLVARPGNASVLLQWAAATPQNADDPAEAVTGYRVYSATRPGVRPDNGSLIDATPTRRGDGRWQLRHTGLQNGQRYYYVVSAQNAGGEGGLSREVWARPRVPAPGVPSGLSTEAGNSRVRIDFTPPDTLPDGETATYNLYWTRALDNDGRGGRSPTEVISNVQPGYDFSEGADTNGTTYFFQVSVVSNGNEGPLSDEVSATPRLPAPERAPQAARTQADSGQVTLDWAPVAEASGYVIYWATEPDIDPRTSNRLRTTQAGFVHDGLENGQSYFYRVAAVNAGGESSLSALLAARPQMPPPPAPSDFGVQSGDGQVTIDFVPSPTASGYRVFWHPDIEAPLARWSSRPILPGDILTGLNNDETYVYRLQAFNAGGTGLLTGPVSATPQPKPPATPGGLAVTGGDGELSIRWPTRPGLRYALYWSDDPEIAPVDSGNVLRDARPTYRHTGLSNDTPYHYQVSASNSGGESAPSEPVEATPTGSMPGIPQAFSAEGGPFQVTLRWRPPANATDDTHYTLYWSTTPNQGINGTALTAVNSPYVHSPLENGQRYYYVITATTGSVEGPASAQVEALSSGGAVPAQPQGVQGSTGDGRNSLQWQPVVDAERYTVQWSTQADMSEFQGAAVSTPSFVHDNPPASTLYYRVIAHNGNGDSPPSAIVKIAQDRSNQAPQITQGAAISVTMDEDSSPTAFALSLTATDNDGDTLNWSVATPAGRGSVEINSNNTSASVSYIPQADANGSDVFIIKVDDGRGGSDSIQVDVSITPQNDAPAITNTGLAPSVGENTTAVTAITVADVDSSTFTYALSGADSALFSMAGNTLRFIAAPDFEAPQDSGKDNVYNVSVTANDGSNDSAAKAFVITVTDANDTVPVITNTKLSLSVGENTTAVTAITVTDSDSTTFTYTLGGTDSGLFSMAGNTLRFIAAPDFEAPQDSGKDNVYNVSVIANDGSNDSAAKVFVITVTGVNDEAPVITNRDIIPFIDENMITVTTITVTDADSSMFTYTLSGADSVLFSMAGNTLRFIAAPDFEAPQDSGTDNIYNVSVTANDGDNDSAAAAFTVTVKNTNDVIPRISNAATLSVLEQTTAVTAITVADADSNAFTYRISGGEDRDFFGLTGANLAFTSPPSFLNPRDANGDNVYRVTVVVSDGVNDSVPMAFAITVTASAGPRWRGAKPIEDATDARSPQIALDAEGNALAVWQQWDGTRYNIWANLYEVNNGWDNAKLIEINNVGGAVQPQIAVDANGTGLAVWIQNDGTRNNVWANRYVAGSGWGKAELIETDNMGNAFRPQIAMDDKGNALAVWYQGDGTRNNVWANRYVASSGWGSAEPIDSDHLENSNDPQIAVDANGNALVVWRQSENIWANRYEAGKGWGSAEPIDPGNLKNADNPQIAMDANGNALTVWRQSENIWVNRYMVGSGWGTAKLIGANTEVAWMPQMAVNASGNAIVVWPQHDGTRFNIWVSRYVGDNGWGNAELIEVDNAGGALDPQVVLDANGNALAVWSQSDGTRSNILANRYVVDSGWSGVELIETDNTGGAFGPQIVLDTNGNALAVWSQFDGTRYNIWANRFE